MTDRGTSFWDKYSLHVTILLGAAVLGGAIYFGGNGEGRQAMQQQGQQEETMAVDISKVSTEGSPYIGNPSAPVTMAIWFDYQCPFCKSFELETVAELEKNYVATGKLKIVYKDFQFQGPDSTNTALFGRAMWEAYPEHFATWFKGVAGITDESLANVKAIAARIPGVDADRVERLMNEKKTQYEAAIAADYAEGVSFGIQGTPGSIIGTIFVNGAQPYAAVAALVEEELK